MKKGFMIFLFSSVLLASEVIVSKNGTINPEIVAKELGVYSLVNPVPKINFSNNKEDVNVGFYSKKRIRKSPLLDQPVDFSVGKVKRKKAEAYLGSDLTTNYYLGNLLEGLSGNLLFGSKQKSVSNN